MSYKALYRKYRPKTFDDVIGQDHIIATFKNIIRNEQISHAYLFSGPRGTGKTSVAHILAREINRNAAKEIKASMLDIIEIDAASNNGVAEIRNLIDSSRYASSQARYKVYIIDEAHMLTKGAFNAFLKTLEEPPKQVVFILATTEPDKIPLTILSRLQRFNFHLINNQIIAKQLQNILNQENIIYNNQVLKTIAQLAKGSLRDALSIADQAAAYGANKISIKTLNEVFGLVDFNKQLELLQYAATQKTKELLQLAHGFINDGADLEILSISLVNILKDVVIYQQTEDQSLLEVLNNVDLSNLNLTLDFSYQALEILMNVLSKLKFAYAPRQVFELALLKMASLNHLKTDKKTKEVELKKESLTLNPTINKANGAKKEPLISTDDLHLTQKILVNNQEEDLAASSLEEDILTTQEMAAEEKALTEVKTDEIDLESMFTNDEQGEENITKDVLNEPAIINLLVQANKELAISTKQKLSNLSPYVKDNQSAKFASLLAETPLIARGSNFLLLTSKNPERIEELQILAKQQSFLKFMLQVFNLSLAIFAIPYEQFKEIKVKYKQLALARKLPPPQPIKTPTIEVDPLSEVEKFGQKVFGDLLKK